MRFWRRLWLWVYWGARSWWQSETTKMTIWRRYRWHDTPRDYQNVPKGPVGTTCSAQFEPERIYSRPLPVLIFSFLSGTLGIV